MFELDFSNKNVLVVGGTSGIGNGIAQKFLSKGATVHVWGTRPGLADYDDDRCNYDGLEYQQIDVSDPNKVEDLEVPFETLDCLILSQGVQDSHPWVIDNFQQVMDINLISFVTCCNKFESMLKASKGTVVMLNSVASQQAITLKPAYSVSKYGMLGLTKLYANRWGPDEVRVNAIAPGVIDTRMMEEVFSHDEYRQAVLSKQPFGRLGTVEEVANVVLFFASPMASYVTGQTLYIDGGYTLQDIV